VLLIGEFDRRRAWAGDGLRSCAHWLNWRVGTSLGAAREQIRVGRALAGLSQTRAAFACGELSYSKVRAITRVASAELEENLVELARHSTASQLEHLVREYRRADPDEARAAEARHRRRYLRSWTDDDGMVVISGRLSPEDGAVVLAAIEAARAGLPSGHGGDSAEGDAPAAGDRAGTRGLSSVPAETQPVDVPAEVHPLDVPAETSQYPETADFWREGSVRAEIALEDPLQVGDTTAADALVALCASVLARGISEEIEDPHVSVVVHVDEQVLGDPSAPGCAHVEGLGAISGHAARRLACDGAVSRVLFAHDGSVEAQGVTRVVPPTMRRALLARDRGCRWPGCTSRRFLHAHHVVFWSQGGPTALSNLVTLCGAHHRLLHEGRWNLQLDRAGNLRVSSPAGVELPAVPRSQPAEGDGLVATHRRMGLDIGPDTLDYGGGRFDLGLTIDGLLCSVGRSAYVGNRSEVLSLNSRSTRHARKAWSRDAS